jgi:5'-nucleotidase
MKHLSFLFALFLLSCASPRPAQVAESQASGPKLTVIATSDFHGALESEESTSTNGQKAAIGGGAIFAAYIKILKAKTEGPVLWVDGGDMFQGSMASNRFEGAPVIRLFNHLGLHAAALGNHEFDYGPKGKKSVPRSAKDDPRGALKERVKEAKFPFLAANVRDEQGKIPSWTKASHIVQFPGVKVGIVGAATPDTPSTTNAMNLGGLIFSDPLPAVRAEAERLRKEEGVDAVVLVMHIGSGCENNKPEAIEDLSSCSISTANNLVQSLPEGLVDVAVAGHSHRGAIKRIGRTFLLQSFSHGKYLSWAKVPLHVGMRKPEFGGLVQVCEKVLVTEKEKTCEPSLVRKSSGQTEAAVFMGEKINPDAEATALLKPELEQVAALKNMSLKVTVADFFSRSYGAESPLGNLIADLTRAASPKVDLGMANGGGLRADLQAGPLSYGALFNVVPFDNQLAVMKVSGEKLTFLVQQGLFGGQGAYTWSSNLRAKTEACSIKELKVNGKIVDPKRNYTIATSDFLAQGGSGVKNANILASDVKVYWDSQYVLRDLLSEYLQKRKGILRVADFYNPKALRIEREGTCESKPARR